MSPESNKPIAPAARDRRKVCDHCRRRRIRCDGQYPCNQCLGACLTCKRDHVPKRRGPKRGSGRVINELREWDHGEQMKVELPLLSTSSSNYSHGTGSGSIEKWMSEHVDSSASSNSIDHPRWHPNITGVVDGTSDEPRSIYTSDQFRPTSACYLHLIPTCLNLFMEHIYPIMPLLYMPSLREAITRPLEMSEKNILYSLCALTSTHMMGKNIMAPRHHSWDAAGRFFLDECITVRQAYDFVEDRCLGAVVSSYLLSTSFFELNQNRKSWYYLREAITMGQDLGLHDEGSYMGLSPTEELCRRRTFWILYVTERSFAILRHKPLTLSKTPAFPSTLHEYESPEIHSGFMHLVQSYHLLDSSFVDVWNEASDAPASIVTYKSLQQQLNQPHPSHLSLTDIQKADILVTQQWLRLIVWQSSMRQGLLSSSAEDESMTFSYPLKIAYALLDVISSLPSPSIEVHGMGIFEKIFEVGNTMLDVMQACGQNIATENYGIAQDPFGMFVRTLSQTPNSQKQFANLLLAKAAEKPEMQRFSQNVRPALGIMTPEDGTPLLETPANLPYNSAATGQATFLTPVISSRQWRGSIVGEINDAGMITAYDLATKRLPEDSETATAGSEFAIGARPCWTDDSIWPSPPETMSSHPEWLVTAIVHESSNGGIVEY